MPTATTQMRRLPSSETWSPEIGPGPHARAPRRRIHAIRCGVRDPSDAEGTYIGVWCASQARSSACRQKIDAAAQIIVAFRRAQCRPAKAGKLRSARSRQVVLVRRVVLQGTSEACLRFHGTREGAKAPTARTSSGRSADRVPAMPSAAQTMAPAIALRIRAG